MKIGSLRGLLIFFMPITAWAGGVGETWERVDSRGGDVLEAVCDEGPLMVTVGARGRLETLEDGASVWVPKDSGVPQDLREIAWSGSCYVAVGNGGVVLRSTDGQAWQRIEIAGGGDFSGLTWTGSQFVAVERRLSYSTSEDGLSWTRHVMETQPGTFVYAVESFQGDYYLMTDDGVHRTADWQAWSEVLYINNLQDGEIQAVNGRLIALARDGVFSSDDGATWQGSVITTAGQVNSFPINLGGLNRVAWNGSAYVASGVSSTVLRSTDGDTWELVSTGTAGISWVAARGGSFQLRRRAGGMATSSDGLSWTEPRNDWTHRGLPTVWTGGRYVALGAYGMIMTYENGQPWVTRHFGSEGELEYLIECGSFLMAGGEGLLLRSEDGVAWTKVGPENFSNPVEMVWTGTEVLVMANGWVHRSADGITWVSSEVLTSPGYFIDSQWGGGQWVGVSVGGAIWTSPDGQSWTARTSGTTETLYRIAWSGSEWWVRKASGDLLRSVDGVTWEPQAGPEGGVSDLAFAFGKWFTVSGKGISYLSGGAWESVPLLHDAAGGSRLTSTGGRLICSGFNAETEDGIHWNQAAPVPTVERWVSVAGGPQGYVAVGNDGAMAFSENGRSWTTCRRLVGDLSAVVGGDAGWVAVGDAGAILYSADGRHWEEVESGTVQDLFDVAWNNGVFAAVGLQGAVVASGDGRQWAVQSVNRTRDWFRLEAGGEGFQALGRDGFTMESPDGWTWTARAPSQFRDVIWDGSRYVAIGRGIATAEVSISEANGGSWTGFPINEAAYLFGLGWNGAQYLACGFSGVILTSTDALQWTPQVSQTSNDLKAVAWSGSTWVVAGDRGTILSSPDGVVWTKQVFGTQGFQDVTWVNDQFIAVADNGASYRSLDGTDWKSVPGASGSSLYSVAWNGSNEFAAGSGLYRFTGTIWDSLRLRAPQINDLGFRDGHWIAATASGIHRLEESTPTRWSSTPVFESSMLRRMVHHDDQWVAVGDDDLLLRSSAAGDWEVVNGGRSTIFDGWAYGSGKWVGVTGESILVTDDMRRWVEPTVAPPSRSSGFADVCWTGSRFVKVATRVALSSQDADVWTEVPITAHPQGLLAVTGNERRLVAVGENGLIVISEWLDSDFLAWMRGQGVGEESLSEEADANADGINNLLAYAFGIPAVAHSHEAAVAALPKWRVDGGGELSFELREGYRAGLRYRVELSTDLTPESWQVCQEYDNGWSTASDMLDVMESPLPGGGVGVILGAVAGETSCFVRIRVDFSG